jgi:hypothetical protein
MPSPALLKHLAITKFQKYRIRLPPSEAGGGRIAGVTQRGAATLKPDLNRAKRAPSNALPVTSATAPGGMTVPPALFLAASGSAPDVRNQKEMHEDYMLLFEKLSDAVKYAWDMWRSSAYFEGLTIMAVSAMGRAGCLKGPSLDKLIKTAPAVAAWTGRQGEVRDGFAAGLHTSWAEWQNNVTVPGLPWYPSFTAVPVSQAPPTPNVPTPLARCVSPGVAAMGPEKLQSNLSKQLSGKMEYHEQFSDAMAVMISTAFTQWLPAQMVMNVLGRGPVPSFAPPYVPVGPVVMGDNIATPGHLGG